MNLEAQRKQRGLTRGQLATATGITPTTIADIERGKTAGAPSTLQRLSEFFAAAPLPDQPATTPVVPDSLLCEGVRVQRELEGLSVADMARRMGVTKARVVAMENGDAALVDRAWTALDALKDEPRMEMLPEGHCGFCGKVHLMGRCG